MSEVTALPSAGGVFFDPRDAGRTLRVSWHAVTRTYVLSVWRDGACAATFQLPVDEVPDLVRALMTPLTEVPSARESTG
jgi:hypothetical protein